MYQPWLKLAGFALSAAFIFSTAVVAADLTTKEMEDWFNADPEKTAAEVNEGVLVFLNKPPAQLVHHHDNSVVITKSTLKDGWSVMTQCHQNLDQVPRAQIMFNRERTRALKIQSYSGIKRAWVEENSVQLEDMGPGAKLCVTAESHNLVNNGDGTYSLFNGPFMRRFLDGYYPMRVSMNVRLASSEMKFVEIYPTNQAGFKVWQTPREMHFDAWFEGKLITEIKLKTTKKREPAALKSQSSPFSAKESVAFLPTIK